MVTEDTKKGRTVAGLLYSLFSSTGIFGRMDMPEDEPPAGVERGSLEHILFLTLTVSIDYQRDATALWRDSRGAFEASETRYLFNPMSLHENRPAEIIRDMERSRLSKKQKKDAYIWRTVGVTFFKKWGGDPRNFLENCRWDSLTVLERLKNDTHVYNNKPVSDYPYLRGPKIGALWLRMLRDNAGISKLHNLDKVPIPVDIHIARASLALGIVRGQFQGRLDTLYENVRNVWFGSVKGLEVKGRPMIALDIDEPLWHLSRYGCSKRSSDGTCPQRKDCGVHSFCIPGTLNLQKGIVEIDT